MRVALYIGAALAVALITGIAVYSGVCLRRSGGERDNSSGIVAGLIMGTLVGGSSTVGTAQLAYRFGMAAWWFTLGAGIACVILAAAYVGPLRRSGCTTLVGILRQEYGPQVGITASLLSVLGTFINILSQLLAASAVVLVIWPGAGTVWSVIFSAVAMVLYVALGGTKGAGIAGILKLALLYLTMLLCGGLALRLFGGTSKLLETVQGFCGDTGVNFFSLFARGVGADLGACLSLILGVLTTQTYAQGILTARSDGAARRGCLTAALLIPPIGICGILVGLYMRSVTDPAVFSSKTALTQFALENLPPLAGGVVLGTLFIASVGTGAGLALGISTIVRCDVLPRLIRRNPGDAAGRLIIAAVLAGACALSLGPIGDMILNFAFMSMGLRGAVVFVPLCCALWQPGAVNWRYALLSVAVSPALVLIFGAFFADTVSFDPLFIGVFCAICIMGFGRLKNRADPLAGQK